MTPPERLQDVTLAERLLAGANACTAHRMPGTAALLREAAAALSVRGDGWVAVADDNRWKAMRKAVAAAKRPDADWYRRNIERDGDTDAMAGPSPTIGQQAVDAEMVQRRHAGELEQAAAEVAAMRARLETAETILRRIRADPSWRTNDNDLWRDICAALAAHGKPNA